MIDTAAYRRQVEESVAFLRDRLPFLPEIVVELGTGLGGLAEALAGPTVIPYRDIPHFPLSTVESHAGNLVCGELAGKKVAVLQGRVHCYEGYSAREVALPIRVLALLGGALALAVFVGSVFMLPRPPPRPPAR